MIGIDHGFGQMKTAHACFKTGVTAHDREPAFKSDLLVYEGRYYTIGEEHKEFVPDKALDQDYYILTLAAIGRELRFRGMTAARVYLAAGLPLTWVSQQRDTFKAYLLQKPSADFTFRGIVYHVDFAGAEIYPQGFAAAYGLSFPERRAKGFKIAYEGHECQWNGPSWPFATSIALTALAVADCLPLNPEASEGGTEHGSA